MSENSGDAANEQKWLTSIVKIFSGMSEKQRGISTMPIILIITFVANLEKIPKPYVGPVVIAIFVLASIAWAYILREHILERNNKKQNIEGLQNEIEELQNELEQEQDLLNREMLNSSKQLETIREQAIYIKEEIGKVFDRFEIQKSMASKLYQNLDSLISKIESQQEFYNTRATTIRAASEDLDHSMEYYENIYDKTQDS